MSITNYLRKCQQALRSLANVPLSRQDITLVVGNESADLDSCVSSIAYGYLATIKAGTGGLTIPVLNLPREDIKLRAELSLLLKSVNVAEADLVCRDELPSGITQASRIPFVLLDHNHFKLEGLSAQQVSIKSIIDHHVDESLYMDASPRIIRPCGSCTSLVVDYFSDLWRKNQIVGETQLTRLALSAILIDTSRLSNQTTETDFNVVHFLRSRMNETRDWNEDVQYKSLQKAKRNVDGLSFGQLLRRDYKEWDLDSDVGLWGVSSITTSMEDLLSMKDWQSDLDAHCSRRKLDVYIIMTKHGEKELLITLLNHDKRRYFDGFIENATTEMLLKDWESNHAIQTETFKVFQQGELSATRKKVASICQSIRPTNHDSNGSSSL